MKRAARLALAVLFMVVVGAGLVLAQGRARLEQGGHVFMNSGCHGCHTVGKLGTPIGPDLSHLGSKYAPDYLERWLRDPLEVRPNAHMPQLELAENQVLALAAYLSSLR